MTRTEAKPRSVVAGSAMDANTTWAKNVSV
jgi:hypothetical protein